MTCIILSFLAWVGLSSAWIAYWGRSASPPEDRSRPRTVAYDPSSTYRPPLPKR